MTQEHSPATSHGDAAGLGEALRRILLSLASNRCYACGWPIRGKGDGCAPFNCSMRFKDDSQHLAEKEKWHERATEMADVLRSFTAISSPYAICMRSETPQSDKPRSLDALAAMVMTGEPLSSSERLRVAGAVTRAARAVESTPSHVAPIGEPGRIPELEPTRRNAEYWRTSAHEQGNIDEKMLAMEQAINAWKNAAYAAWDKINTAADMLHRAKERGELTESERVSALSTTPRICSRGGAHEIDQCHKCGAIFAASATACSEEPMAWAVMLPAGYEFDYVVHPHKEEAAREIEEKELPADALVPLFRRPDGTAKASDV